MKVVAYLFVTQAQRELAPLKFKSKGATTLEKRTHTHAHF
jgi:hypothetical protein